MVKNSYFSLPFTCRLIQAGLYKGKRKIMKVNIQMFFPGSGILHCCNYRAHTGMMIGPDTLLALGQITVHPQILRHYMPFKTQSPTGATKTSQPWEELAGQRIVSGQVPAHEASHWAHSRLPRLHVVTADAYNDSRLGSSSGRQMRDIITASKLWLFDRNVYDTQHCTLHWCILLTFLLHC